MEKYFTTNLSSVSLKTRLWENTKKLGYNKVLITHCEQGNLPVHRNVLQQQTQFLIKQRGHDWTGTA